MKTLDLLPFALKLSAVLGCGLVAGIFFAFSTFVMKALAQLQPKEAMAAMQWINITVINPWFITVFLGTAIACLCLSIYSLFKWHPANSTYLLLGSLLYVVGTVLVTMVFNVPLNDALAKVEPSSAEGASLWTRYLTDWTMWNHVRTLAALLAAALFTIEITL
ncbi:MAG: DUF1772 domain-containing protein [Waterburya sp.]